LDGTIEHSGLVVGGSNIVTPLSRYMSSSWAGYLGRCAVSHNVSAVAADCMFISRKVFEAVGGFSEELSIAYSDVDFCLKARQQGYYTVYTPFATLTHFRSVSRLRSYSQAFLIKQKREAALLQYRWPDYFVKGDRYYSSNFDPNSPYYGLRDN
jgi:GT2 family glycosyltransferase